MKNTKKRGFTIVELVIVIAVIAILAAVLIPTFSTVIDNAKKSAALQEARNAWTNYLASKGKDIDTTEVNAIHYNGYCFKIENGKINEAAELTDTCHTAGNYYEVSNGTLVPSTTTEE